MGKGSKPRPTDKSKFNANWDEINWNSKKNTQQISMDDKTIEEKNDK